MSSKHGDETVCHNLTRSITKRILPVPLTPNIDQLKLIFDKFKSHEDADESIFDRANTEELSQITKKVPF
jgi:hypothetical protein